MGHDMGRVLATRASVAQFLTRTIAALLPPPSPTRVMALQVDLVITFKTSSNAKRLAATADTTAAGLLAVAASTTNSNAKSKPSPLAAKDKSKAKALAISKDPSGSAADYAHRLHHARRQQDHG